MITYKLTYAYLYLIKFYIEPKFIIFVKKKPLHFRWMVLGKYHKWYFKRFFEKILRLSKWKKGNCSQSYNSLNIIKNFKPRSDWLFSSDLVIVFSNYHPYWIYLIQINHGLKMGVGDSWFDCNLQSFKMLNCSTCFNRWYRRIYLNGSVDFYVQNKQ